VCFWLFKGFTHFLSNIFEGGGVTMPNKKQTSKSVAKTASKILRDGRFSPASKKVAASALSQTKRK
jgi:hypothetical protein